MSSLVLRLLYCPWDSVFPHGLPFVLWTSFLSSYAVTGSTKDGEADFGHDRHAWPRHRFHHLQVSDASKTCVPENVVYQVGGLHQWLYPKTDGVWKIPNKNGWWWFGGTPMTSWLGVWSSYGGFCSKFHGWFGGFRDPWGYPHSWMVYGWENHRKSPWKWMITRGTPILGHIHLFCDCFVTEVCDPHGSCAECCQGAWSCTTSLVTGPPRNDHCLSVLVPVDKNEPLKMPLLMSCLFNWLGVIPTGLLVYGYCSNLLYPLD